MIGFVAAGGSEAGGSGMMVWTCRWFCSSGRGWICVTTACTGCRWATRWVPSSSWSAGRCRTCGQVSLRTVGGSGPTPPRWPARSSLNYAITPPSIPTGWRRCSPGGASHTGAWRGSGSDPAPDAGAGAGTLSAGCEIFTFPETPSSTAFRSPHTSAVVLTAGSCRALLADLRLRSDRIPFPVRANRAQRHNPHAATHAKGWARHRARARDYTTDITSALLTASPLAKCDFVSQRQMSEPPA
jgi:hypothetical protein